MVPEVGLEPTLPEGNRILSPLPSQTRADTEGQGGTKLRFYRGLGASEGRDTQVPSNHCP